MPDKLTPEALEYFRKQGARGGKIGSKARMNKLTPEQRSEIARNAGKVRWARKAQQNGTTPTPAALSKNGKPATTRRTNKS